MFFSRPPASSTRFAAIFEIGSGSVLAAIVESKSDDTLPSIVWKYREVIPHHAKDAAEAPTKAIMVALMNAAMQLDAQGRSALRSYQKNAKLAQVYYNIAAPWSYTITQQVTYRNDVPFTVTNNRLKQLTVVAEEKISQKLQHNNKLQELGLVIINREIFNILTNGYTVYNPIGQRSTEVLLTYGTIVTPESILIAVRELHEKMFRSASLTITSQMNQLYQILNELTPNQTDYCIINITFEATEIGIVRDGTFRYSTHTGSGVYTIARSIAKATDAVTDEVYHHLVQGTLQQFLQTQSSKNVDRVEAILLEYRDSITALFHETGDTLAIPRTLFLNAEIPMTGTIVSTIKAAATAALGVEPVTSTILHALEGRQTKTVAAVGPVLSGALFFHTEPQQRFFTPK